MQTDKIYTKTPLIFSDILSRINNTNVYLKLDNLQPSGSFKIRGIGELAIQKHKIGGSHLISSSGGNAGLATSYVAKSLNLKCTIVTPKTVFPSVVEKMKQQGADVIIYGDVWDESDKEANRLVNESMGAVYVPPFDHELIWKGNSTIVDEILEQIGNTLPDCIIASIGGGGLIIGLIEGLIRNGWADKDITLIGVETIGADCFNKSVKANRLYTLDNITSIAKSLGAKTCSKKLFEYYLQFNNKIESIVVEDNEVVKTIGLFLDDHKMLIEAGCAASLTVAYNLKKYLPNKKFKNVVVEVCGGSAIDLNSFLNYKKIFSLN